MRGGFGPRFLLEAIFLVLVAVVAGLSDLSTAGIILVMAAAWLLTAGVEWTVSRLRAPDTEIDVEAVDAFSEPSTRDGVPAEAPPTPEEAAVTPAHVRILPREPDPAAQPVLERPAAEPAALVEDAAAAPPEPATETAPPVLEPTPPTPEPVEPPPSDVTPLATPVAEVTPPEEPAEAQRPALAAVHPPTDEPDVEPREEDSPVTRLPVREAPREWNLWDLERMARARAGENTLRDEEWAYLLVYMREFASPDGRLPVDFDALVRESFGELVASSPR